MQIDHWVQERLAGRAARGLTRTRRCLASAQGPVVEVGGRSLLNFCSNDYLGLAGHPTVKAAMVAAVEKYGVGSGASHLVAGHHEAHARLEAALAEWAGYPACLLFSAGYMANLGVIAALLGRSDSLCADELNHASLIDGGRLSRACYFRYPHADMTALECMLSNGTVGKCLVVTDGVFSMDGDVAPLASIAACCERSGAGLMVDDAHGFGVLGPGGRGSVADAGLTPAQVPILVGTLGKAFGTTGAFVLGSQALVQALVQFARTYVYTTAMPPALAMASLESLSLVRSGERQAQLHERIKQFRRGAQQLGFQLLPSDTPIQPLVVGDSDRVMHLSGRLQEQGILLAGIRPPTVPEGTARLRVALSASHRPIDVDKLLEALASLSQDGLI